MIDIYIKELCSALICVAYVSLSSALTLMDYDKPQYVEPVVETEVVDISEEKDPPYYKVLELYIKVNFFVEHTPIFTENVPDNLEEYSCIMYATQSIGRYYITAYNDEETHCKVTASGGKVHEGTITTCAADPRYHKFGEYLEIDGRLYVVEDTGSAVKKRHIDIFFDDYKKMARYGSNYQTIYKVTFPFGRPK